MDEVTAYMSCEAYPQAQDGLPKFRWIMSGSDDNEQRAVRYRLDLTGKHMPIGVSATNLVNIAPVKERPMPLFDLKVGLQNNNPERDQYQLPVIVYQISIHTKWSGRRVGIMEFTIDCVTGDNYLFSLKDGESWHFTLEPSKYYSPIGAPLVRYLLGRHGVYNRVLVQFVQTALFYGEIPEIVLRVTPRLHYYPNDQPTPPEPRWYARGVCKLLTYTIATTKPVEVAR